MRRLGADMNLKELEVLVLDEADRLLDMGFEVCSDLRAVLFVDTHRLPNTLSIVNARGTLCCNVVFGIHKQMLVVPVSRFPRTELDQQYPRQAPEAAPHGVVFGYPNPRSGEARPRRATQPRPGSRQGSIPARTREFWFWCLRVNNTDEGINFL
jgi:hypothetical protein